MWGLAMLLAAASVSFGAFASAAQLFGTEVEVTVLGCDSEVLGRTTELTTFCEVSLGAPGPKRVEDVQVDREYATGAQILLSLGVDEVRLLTNNPAKAVGLEQHGVHVAEQLPIVIAPTGDNLRYLQAKAERMGHHLPGLPDLAGMTQELR